MLEKLLGKVLNGILGDYFEGFDSNNLDISLWSGEVNIQNIRVKKEAVKMLGMPLTVSYSHIRSLRLKIPWKSLTSSKTEVYIDGAYIVMGYQPENEWQLRDGKLVERRKREVRDFKEAVLKRYAERLEKKSGEEQDGFTSRLILKILDNLQIEVKDIHIRVEDQQDEEYAFGLTLEALRMNTVNKQGVAEYIDRTKAEYQNQPLRKHLQLRNLGLYWSKKAQMTKPDTPALQIQQRLKALQRKSEGMSPYIVLISFDAKLLQSQKGNFAVPETLLQVDMETLRFDVDDRQLQQLITLSEKLQKYKLKVRLSNQAQLPPDQKRELLDQFTTLYSKYYGKPEKQYSPQDFTQYESLLEKLPIQQLMRPMKKEILDHQKQKMIEQKSTVKKGWGWFSSESKKELSEAEITQIQQFLHKNFNEQYRPVTRPEDYFHIQLELNLRTAEIVIGSKVQNQSMGVGLTISEVKVGFQLREGGYKLQVSVADLRSDLIGIDLSDGGIVRTNVFSKMEKFRDENYLQLGLQSNPLGQPNISSNIDLSVKASIVVFNPEIVSRLKRFGRLKLNQQNRQAAIERLGEIRSQTSVSLERSIKEVGGDSRLTNINVSVRAPLLIIPFEPGTTALCWGVNMGLLEVHTDPNLLKQESSRKEAFDVKLQHLNFGWFESVESCQRYYQHGVLCRSMQNIIEDFQVHLLVEKSNELLPKIPKLLLKGTISSLELKVSEYSYERLKLLDRSFQPLPEKTLPSSDRSIPAADQQNNEDQKQAILNNRDKLGVIHKRNNASKLWEKFTCVLSGNYLYMYGAASKQNYQQCLFVKNSKIVRVDERESGRSNTMELSNKVESGVVLAFDKPTQYQQWEKAILAKCDYQPVEVAAILDQPDDSPKKIQPAAPVNYSQLNMLISMELKELRLVIYQQKWEDNWLDVRIRMFSTMVEIYEARVSILLLLNKLDIYDTVQVYRDRQLDFLLKTDAAATPSHLISVNIVQVDPKDPSYQRIDNNITIEFGVQRANWKPQTIRKLFRFFLPATPSAPQEDILKDTIKDVLLHQEFSLEYVEQQKKVVEERTLLNISITVKQITLSLINQNNNVKLYELLFRRLAFTMKQSTIETNIEVTAGNLLTSDCSGYPNTILTESEYYPNLFTFVRSLEDNERDNLVEVRIRIIAEVDPGQKDLFVTVLLHKIYIDFMKQPFLRTIDYIVHQFIPSLSNEPVQTKSPPQKTSESKIIHPEYSTWSLNVSADESVVRLRPSPSQRDEVVDLHLTKITVKKQNLERRYILGSEATTLVDAFTIEMTHVYLSVRDHQITNGLDLQIVIDSVVEPRYYRREYGSSFEDGVRLYLKLGSFLLRANNRDINTVRKCLAWNVGYDDNCGAVLLPSAPKEQSQSEEPSPFFLDVQIDRITFVAATNVNLPIGCFSVHRIKLLLTDRNQTGLFIEAEVGEITASTFTRTEKGKILERGLLRSTHSAGDKEYEQRDLLDMPQLVRLLYFRASEIVRLDETYKQLQMRLSITNSRGTTVQLKCEHLKFCLELLPLLQLSKLADGDDSLVPPAPRLPSLGITGQSKLIETNRDTNLRLLLSNTTISTKSDKKEQQTGITGDFQLEALIKPAKDKQVVQKTALQDSPIDNTKISIRAINFAIYLTETDEKGTTKRRTLLLPLNLNFEIIERYTIAQERLIQTYCVTSSTDTIILKVTVRDLLSLASIGQHNNDILQQWNKENQVAGLELERIRETQRELMVHKLRHQSLQDPAPAANVQRGKSMGVLTKHQSQLLEIEETTVVNHTAEIEFKQLELEIINDCGMMFVPVLQLLLAQSKPVMRASTLQTSLGSILTIELNFFNPRSARWQPILQQCQLTLGYISNSGVNSHSEINISAGTDRATDSSININISSQMIRCLEESIALAKLQLSSTNKRIFENSTDEELEISPYVFENMTNTDIIVIIPDHQGADATDSKPTYRSKTLPSRFRGSVAVPLKSNEITLRIGDNTYAVNINIFGKRQICNSRYFIECKVEKLNRLVKFTGDLYLLNDTNESVYVKWLDGHIEEVKPRTQLPLQNRDRIYMGSQSNRLSELINLNDLADLTKVSSYNNHCHYVLQKKARVISHIDCKKFYVKAPLKILNGLPRAILIQAYPRDSKTASPAQTIKSQTEVEVYRYGRVTDLLVRICAPGYLWSAPIELAVNLNKQVDIVLKDRTQNPTVIKASIVEKEDQGCFQLTFFTTAYLINDTPYNLLVYSVPKELSEKRQYRVAGQLPASGGEQLDQNLVVLGSEVGTQLKFAERETPDELSSAVRIDQLGYNEAVIEIRQTVNGKLTPTYLTLGVDIEVKEMYKDSGILTKEVRVTARHIIVNKTDRRLYYKQVGTTEAFQLQKGQRRVAYLLDKDPEKRKVLFRSGQSEQSSPLSLKGLGTTHFYLLQGNKKVFMRMVARIVDSYLFLVVERLSETEAPYELYNRVKKLSVKVRQLDEEEVRYKERVNFSWKNPDDSHLITLSLWHEDARTIQSIEINPDEVNTKQLVELQMRTGKRLRLEIVNELSNTQDTRVITIQPQPQKPVQDKLELIVRTFFRKIGVSFILNHQTVARPYEFVYGYLQNLQFVNERTHTTDTYQLRLGFMQVDQNYPNELMTPVVFTPEKYNEHLEDPENYLINTVLRIDRRSQRHLIIKQLSVEVKDITVRVSQQFIKVLRDISRDTTKNQADYMIRQSKNQWLQLEIAQQDRMMYIQDMRIYAFYVNLTCHINLQALQERRGYLVQQVALQAFGVAFTNIEEAYVLMKGISLTNSYETPQQIVNKLVLHYKHNFFNEVYKLFGSLNIIGNPLGLFNNITTGLTDLVVRPARGAVNGPIELGKGIVSGAHSLVAHTVGGVLNSFSQITNSLSNGLTILCFDRYFQELRDRNRLNPPTGVFDGMAQGAKSLYVGVREGLFGVIGQPIRATKKNGLIGGVLGLVAGATGIVIKPATGVLDALTKSTSGLKSTILGQQNRANTQRIRNPRVFYGGNSLIKPYSAADSHMYQTLQQLDKKYTSSPFIQSFIIKDDRFALVALQNYVVMLTLTDSTIYWAIETSNILQVTTPDSLSLTIVLRQQLKLKLHHHKTLSIDCVDQPQRDEIRRLLVEMVQLSERVIQDQF